MGLVKSKRRKALNIAICVGMILFALVVINFIPTFFLKNPRMTEPIGQYTTVYYESEEAAAKDILQLVDNESDRIAKKLGFAYPQDITFYIYDSQHGMQIKKYGFVVLFLGLDFYVGDNRSTNVILTSPANPGNGHDYESVKEASVHEMVHAYNSILNPGMSLWFNEGMATYLARGQNPREDLYSTSYYVPSIAQMNTTSPIEFAEIGGYDFAYTYVEYLDSVFGWDIVLTYAKSGNYIGTFGKDENSIYNGWIEFLEEHYR
jgi:hypothetical protein